jgi:hypothetical protein
MVLARRTFAWALTVAALAAFPLPAHAQRRARTVVAQSDSAARAALVAERQRVRAELERANADVDALKRADHTLRDDYRLRARLADAEALARQLTSLDARLGGAPTARGPSSWSISSEPRAAVTDGPAELDAKADILNDEARRLTTRADLLLGRARDLKARQALRRRVGQMEHDPFSPLEGSKRRAMTAGATSLANGASAPPHVTSGGGPDKTPPSPGSTTVTTSVPPENSGSSSTGGLGTATAAAPGGPLAPSAPVGPGVALTGPKTAPTVSGTISTGTTTDGVALSVQLRDLLDPATLAELQQLEATGHSSGGPGALERAGAALKARAASLDEEAAALRASGHAPPRAR